MTRIGTAFLPVSSPRDASDWYRLTFGLSVEAVDDWSAVMVGADGHRLTLLGPASGIKTAPGLPWATHNLVVDDLDATHARLGDEGTTGELMGDPRVCRFFTMVDPDSNTLLVCDR